MLKALFDLEKSQEIEEIDLVFRGGWVLALFLIAAAIGFAIYLYRSERNLPPKRRLLMTICQGAALLTLILVILQPAVEVKTTREYQPTMIVMLDTSRSMLAEDLAPNRLERAKLAILDCLERLEGDRVGLVAFAGSAFVQCPMTTDVEATRSFLRALEPGGRFVLALRLHRDDVGRFDRSRFGMTEHDLEDLLTLLDETGFRDVRVERSEIRAEHIATLVMHRGTSKNDG